MKDDIKREHFYCDCCSIEHQVVFSAWDWDDDDSMYVHVSLNKSLPWYRRVYEAVRYVFNLDECSWHFDDVVLDRNDAARMRAFLDKYIEGKKDA